MATSTSQSLAKGLRLLARIVSDAGRSSLTTLAADAGLPLATAHRLVLTLEAEGFLVRGRKGHYHPGPALEGMAAVPRREEAQWLAQRAAARLREPLARLSAQHGGPAHFGILEDGMVTYLVKENGAGKDLFTAEQMQLEAYCSAIGKVLLAAMDEPALEDYLSSGPFVALTANTLTDPAAIRADVEQARRRGVGFDRCEIREDLFCMAVPVRMADGRTAGAISLSLLGHTPDRAEQGRIIRQLRRAATGAVNALEDSVRAGAL